MTSPVWETLAEGFGKLEAPCVEADGSLLFAERQDPGSVFRLAPDGEVKSVVDRHPSVGGIAVHANGGFIVAARKVTLVSVGYEQVLLEPTGGWGFNDLITDAVGRVYVGMHGEAPTRNRPEVKASLWRIDLDGTVVCCYGDIEMTNGLALSPDGTHLYHNDTLRSLVFVSDVAGDGTLTGRRVFHQVTDGLPDGMAVDIEGYVWVASMHAGKLVRIAPNGAYDETVEVPMPCVSSLCFGGDDGRDLYVTTFGAPLDPAHTGSILRTRVEVPGCVPPPARV